MTTLEWLNTENTEGRTVLSELAELVGLNGGMSFRGFGVFQVGGPYGRLGVTVEEAIKLMFLSGVLEGFTRAEEGVHQATVVQMIKDEIKRAAAELRSSSSLVIPGAPTDDTPKP